MDRRHFLQLNAGFFLLPSPRSINATHLREPVLTIGVIADLHHGLAPDALKRLEQFMIAVDASKPDMLIQLGDFNFGRTDSKECMDLWHQYRGPSHHVLGNHDMDFYGKQHMTDLWEMPHRYYSFDQAGYHFVVLDRNNLCTPQGYVPYDTANFYVDSTYRGYADPEQLEWLRDDLEQTDLPTIVFSHQGLGMDPRVLPSSDPRGAIEHVLKKAINKEGRPKVHSCFCGHHHLDRYQYKYGIHFVWINSASYYWVGQPYGRMAFYIEPLYTYLTLFSDGVVKVAGTQTDWMSPSPEERGYPDVDQLTTYIADRTLLPPWP